MDAKNAARNGFVKIIVVIPARYGSSRLAGKVLAKETGKYLVEHTYERALCAKRVNEVVIATDDERVVAACRTFGAPCVMTSVDHQSGTDRIAEAVAGRPCDIVVNLQADEPEIDPAYIDRVAGAPGVAAWIADALAEQDFLDFEEPYRKHR